MEFLQRSRVGVSIIGTGFGMAMISVSLVFARDADQPNIAWGLFGLGIFFMVFTIVVSVFLVTLSYRDRQTIGRFGFVLATIYGIAAMAASIALLTNVGVALVNH